MRCLLIMAVSGTIFGQAIIEKALITGHTSTAAGAAGSKTGASITSVMGKVNRELDKAVTSGGGATPSAALAGRRPAQAARGRGSVPLNDLQKPSTKPEGEIAKIEKGMKREQVLEMMGTPQGTISLPEGGKLIERMRYNSGRVILTDGQVTLVEPAS